MTITTIADLEPAARKPAEELKEQDDPKSLDLEVGRLPGGRYLRARLRGEPPGVYERIGPTFESLASASTPDETRPSIEFNRKRDEIDLLLPVAEEAGP